MRTPLIARVTALQDHLGLMNDADVTASMARTFLVEHAGDLSAAESGGDRPLPGRPREGGRATASDDRADRGAASPASGSGGRSDGSSPPSSDPEVT